MSALPIEYEVKIPIVGSSLRNSVNWFRANDGSLQELRPLATLQEKWIGKWYDIDKNYYAFERWFTDNLALRSLMIRLKNQVDYYVFRSSSRVYYGAGLNIYGRHLIDVQLPETEQLMNSNVSRNGVIDGILNLNEKLKKEGVQPIWVIPMMKEYFFPYRLPWYAPHLQFPTNFQKFYGIIKENKNINFVDVYGILNREKGRYPIFYLQDFHWTDIGAALISREVIHEVAELSGQTTKWNHPINLSKVEYIGSESRFSARFSADEPIVEPILNKNWTDRHRFNNSLSASSGLEFETDVIADRNLLPPTCLYGNSFSEGMVRAGLPDYFQKITKLSRNLKLSEIPQSVKGRCLYVVIQVLDISTNLWSEVSYFKSENN